MMAGVARIPAAEIAKQLREPHHKLQYDLFDFRDGLKGTATQLRPLPSAVEDGDGRIRISGSDGVYWVDPVRIYKNPIPPPVSIEAIYEGNQRFSAFEASHLPKLPQNVRIEYTALSLSIPERVRFRDQLEGYDKGWQDSGTRRFALYTKLPPGRFRFHVIASNNDGVWNQTGAVAEIVVPPAFYQTQLFESACGFAGLALLWGAYRYRLHQIARGFNMRLDERVNERTRLARDLHDTLLQGFQGLMLRLQAIDESLPPGEVKDELKRTLDRGDQVVAESRKAVHDLRLSTVITNDLARAVRTMGDELSSAGSATFALLVEGETRELHPIVRDEVYRIAREALRNAFNHARAGHIEAEITYAESLFRLRVRDDGEGVAPAILEGGRVGHYGLPGMRERAAEIGAKLDIWSGAGTGTEIDLSIGGSIAYGNQTGRLRE
jgi:signal transduction histidine kinase